MSLETEQKTKIVSIPYLCAAGTDVGRKRSNNEDTFVFDASNGFFMVVDGMGGYEKGEVAAQNAAETIQTGIRKIEESADVRLRDSIILANNAVFELAQNGNSAMGCVLTALLIENNKATVGHIGDTRLYKISEGKIQKLTKDHSIVGQLEAEGGLSEQRLMEHPLRNEVTRCVGFEKIEFENENFVDVFETDFETNSAFLLCSDGLSDLLTTAQIFEIIENNSNLPNNIVEKLIAKANELGGKDNITVLFISGQDFANSIAPFEEIERSKKQKFISIFLNRPAFFIYGLLLGFVLLFLFFKYFFPI